MSTQPDLKCEHCEKTILELWQRKIALYSPVAHGQHPTCALCVANGKDAGLSFGQVMTMNRQAYERALKRSAAKAAERKVIPFDPMKKLPKPKK